MVFAPLSVIESRSRRAMRVGRKIGRQKLILIVAVRLSASCKSLLSDGML